MRNKSNLIQSPSSNALISLSESRDFLRNAEEKITRNKSNLTQTPKSDHKASPLVLKSSSERRAFLQMLELWRIFDLYFHGLRGMA